MTTTPAHATPTTKAPQPVLTRAGIITAISVLASLLIKIGAPKVAGDLSDYSDVISGFVLAVGPTLTALISRKHVTPLSAPKDADGNELAPVPALATVEPVTPVEPVAPTTPTAPVVDVLKAAEAIYPVVAAAAVASPAVVPPSLTTVTAPAKSPYVA